VRPKPGFRVCQNERVSPGPGPGFFETRVGIPSLQFCPSFFSPALSIATRVLPASLKTTRVHPWHHYFSLSPSRATCYCGMARTHCTIKGKFNFRNAIS